MPITESDLSPAPNHHPTENDLRDAKQHPSTVSATLDLSNPKATEVESDDPADVPFYGAEDGLPCLAPSIPWRLIGEMHIGLFRDATEWLNLDEVGITGDGDLFVRRDVEWATERLMRPGDLAPDTLRERIIMLVAKLESASLDRGGGAL